MLKPQKPELHAELHASSWQNCTRRVELAEPHANCTRRVPTGAQKSRRFTFDEVVTSLVELEVFAAHGHDHRHAAPARLTRQPVREGTRTEDGSGAAEARAIGAPHFHPLVSRARPQLRDAVDLVREQDAAAARTDVLGVVPRNEPPVDDAGVRGVDRPDPGAVRLHRGKLCGRHVHQVPHAVGNAPFVQLVEPRELIVGHSHDQLAAHFVRDVALAKVCVAEVEAVFDEC